MGKKVYFRVFDEEEGNFSPNWLLIRQQFCNNDCCRVIWRIFVYYLSEKIVNLVALCIDSFPYVYFFILQLDLKVFWKCEKSLRFGIYMYRSKLPEMCFQLYPHVSYKIMLVAMSL